MKTIPRSRWGGRPLPLAGTPWGPGDPTYLHHTVTAHIDPEPLPAGQLIRPPHLGILGVYRFEPGWATKAKLLRRYRRPHSARGGVHDGTTVPGVRRWVQMEVRRAGDGRYVVVQIDPERVNQLKRKARSNRATMTAAALRVAVLERRAMRLMESYHLSLGWSAIGYREVGFPSGRVYVGRGERYGAHCPGANDKPSFSMAGDYSRRTPTKRLRAAILARARDTLSRRIVGHRQHPYPTACPGVSNGYIAALNRDL